MELILGDSVARLGDEYRSQTRRDIKAPVLNGAGLDLLELSSGLSLGERTVQARVTVVAEIHKSSGHPVNKDVGVPDIVVTYFRSVIDNWVFEVVAVAHVSEMHMGGAMEVSDEMDNPIELDIE